MEVHDIVILRNILGFFFGGGRESGFTLFARTKADMIFFFAPQRSKTRVFRQKACAAVPPLLDRQPWFNGVFFRLEGVGKKGCFLVFFCGRKTCQKSGFHRIPTGRVPLLPYKYHESHCSTVWSLVVSGMCDLGFLGTRFHDRISFLIVLVGTSLSDGQPIFRTFWLLGATFFSSVLCDLS